MIEIDYIKLEDGLEYAIVDEIVINDVKYLYLVQEETNKFELRKLDDQDYLIKVENKEEYQKAMVQFAKIHKNDLAN